jgi:RimJ/RimL family protein N-acetyltransferase
MTTIATKRLTLTKSDGVGPHLKRMVQWLNDPVVVQYSEQRHQVHTEETQQEYIADGPDIFREIHTHQGRFIGTITANIDRPNSVADVGILIGEKEEWGKGYGFEAWKGFCDHLLTHGIRKIEAGTMRNNRSMRVIFNRYDMVQEGIRFDHFLYDKETYSDMLLYGKFA